LIQRKLLIFAAIALLALMLCSQTVGATTQSQYITAIKKTADRLVALQSVPPGPPTPADYGWDWVVTGLTSHTASPSATNLYGVTALGLIYAYQETGTSAYLAAAKKTADFMKYGNPSAGDFWNGRGSYSWGYSSDYRFLMTYSAVSGDPSYRTYALAAWAWQKANVPRYADGSQSILWSHFADQWIGTGMYGAGAWGTSDWVLAALQMGDTTWAQHMAAVIHANMTKIIANVNSNDYAEMGMGSALQCLVTLDPITYASDIAGLRTKLDSLQLPDGSWDFGSTPGDPQTTAYVVMGLVKAGDFTAASKGADWLVTNQMTNGGWNESPDENSEPDSEAMQALTATVSLSVGGEWAPISLQALSPLNTVEVLSPWIALAFVAAASAFAVSRRFLKKRL
jgi:hypothetical protein